MAESSEEIAGELRAVCRIGAIPNLLRVLCETTGMGFAAVARVTEESWIACAVEDQIGFGVEPGGHLDVNTTLCIESRAARAPVVIDQASTDPLYCKHPTPALYRIESYVSMPIVLPSGRYFGNLCAIDPNPAQVSHPRVVSMFKRFADIIAMQLESELARDREHAELLDQRATSELRDQFIAILGHDLRNPLQSVHASSEILGRRLTDPALIAITERIRVSARRMSALIDDVLDFARGRLGGGVFLKVAGVDHIEERLGAVVEEIQEANPERRIESHFEVGRTVCCDVGRVQQIASNLLANAIVHGSPHDAVRITARTEGDEFVLLVWNQGEPIPADSLDKIFEPFWRHSTSATREGLGLGLYICAQIVKAHGGRLTVASTADGGTEFTARLPLVMPLS